MKNNQKQLKSKEKKTDTITNQIETLEALTNKDGHKDNFKEISEKVVKERFDEIKELTNENNHDDLIFYFKGNTTIKRFNNFNNGMELFRKIKSCKMKLEEAKKLQYVFKSNLNEISRGKYK